MRIFFLAQRVPYPPDRGDKIATYHQVRHLAERHDIEVFCLADGPGEMAHARALSALVGRVHAIPLGLFTARLRALAALAGRRALTLAYFDVAALHELVRRRIAEAPPDAILVYSSGMAQYVESFEQFPRVMEFGDLDSRKWQQYAASAARAMRPVYRAEARRLLSYERSIAKTFSHSIVCTQKEKKDFEQLIPGVSATCIPNGVDLDYFKPPQCPKIGNSLIFTGTMDYFPNVDAVVWFCDAVMPALRRCVPDVSLVICGRNPNRSVRKLADRRGVTVTGAVDDVRPHLAAAQVAVAPIRVGRGIQNKVLDAMAMGLPCVLTKTAAVGLEAEPGRDFLLADRAEDFAARVLELLSQPAMRRRVGASARLAMEANYSWGAPLGRLCALLESYAWRTDVP